MHSIANIKIYRIPILPIYNEDFSRRWFFGSFHHSKNFVINSGFEYIDVGACLNSIKIEWDLTNRPVTKLLELLDIRVFSGSVQWVLLEISWINPGSPDISSLFYWLGPSLIFMESTVKQWEWAGANR